MTSQLNESHDKLSHSSLLNQQLEKQLQGTVANNASLSSQLDECKDKLSHSSLLNQQLEKQLQGTEANNASLTSRLNEFKDKLSLSSSQLNEARNQLSEVEKIYKLLFGDYEALSERNLCVICQDAQKTILLRPCNHLCLCGNCASNVTAVRRCPLCNTTITERIKVYG